ncbi:MAG: competence protein ComFC [Deferribacteres bacterium]|nr:competence protein ComFC [Deferribacteres bacterium]
MSHSLLDEVFYSRCAVCSKTIKYNDFICEECFKAEVKFIEHVCSACGYPLEISASFCKNCLLKRNYDRLFVACWYEKALRDAVKNIKFRFGLKEKSFIDAIVGQFIQENELNHYDLVVPVPVSFRRRFIRFVHLSERIAKNISLFYGIKYKKILSKKRYTKFQWQYSRKERLVNVKNSVDCNFSTLGLNILLVDDIITTGATVNECARALKLKGAKRVDCFALAKGHFR